LRGDLGQLLLMIGADNLLTIEDPLLHFECVDLPGQVLDSGRCRGC
jgi:hypothetical protein